LVITFERMWGELGVQKKWDSGKRCPPRRRKENVGSALCESLKVISGGRSLVKNSCSVSKKGDTKRAEKGIMSKARGGIRRTKFQRPTGVG